MKIGVISGLILHAQELAVSPGSHQRITNAGIRMATTVRLTQRVAARTSSDPGAALSTA